MIFRTAMAPSLSATLVTAQTQQPAIDGRGAVYCSHAVSAALGAMRRKCRPDNKTLEDVLSYSRSEHRNFVLRNTENTEDDLRAFESANSDLHGRTCQDLADDQWLESLDRIGQNPKELRSEIDYSLAVVREPVWNPCL